MDEQPTVLQIRPRFGTRKGAEIAAPKNAGPLRRFGRRMSSCMWSRYAWVHVDLLVAGADWLSNFVIGALVRQAGLSVGLYYHPDIRDVISPEKPAGAWYDDPEQFGQLARFLNVNPEYETIESVLKAFYSRFGQAFVKGPVVHGVVNIVGTRLIPDDGTSVGMPDGELFWPVRPAHHAAFDARQTVAAMRLPELPTLRFSPNGCSLVTAGQCVMTTSVPQFAPNQMRCTVYNMSHGGLDTALAIAGTLARPPGHQPTGREVRSVGHEWNRSNPTASIRDPLLNDGIAVMWRRI